MLILKGSYINEVMLVFMKHVKHLANKKRLYLVQYTIGLESSHVGGSNADQFIT